MVLAGILGTACQPGEKGSEAAGEAPFLRDGDRLEITGNDRMELVPDYFVVEAGASIEIVFRNIGRVPKERMGHNLVFLERGVEVTGFGRAAIPHAENEYLPPDRMDEVVAATRVLGPGEVETLRFRVSEEPGTSFFVCTFVGHADRMNGVMEVVPGEAEE